MLDNNVILRTLTKTSTILDPVGPIWESTPDDSGLLSFLRSKRLSPKMLNPNRVSFAEIRRQASREEKEFLGEM